MCQGPDSQYITDAGVRALAAVSIQRLAWCWLHSLSASSMPFLKYSGALAATCATEQPDLCQHAVADNVTLVCTKVFISGQALKREQRLALVRRGTQEN